MTLRVLNLVQLRNWMLFGTSLRRGLQRWSWKISCMQFGILPSVFKQCNLGHGWPNVLYLVGIVYPWTALAPFYLQNLNSLIKGQAKVCKKKFSFIVWTLASWLGKLSAFGVCGNLHDSNHYWSPPFSISTGCQSHYTETCHLHSSFGGCIHQIWWPDN